MMVRRKPFDLMYAHQTKKHMMAIGRRYFSLVKKAIEDQLTYEPDVETRNRKPLKRAVMFQATWEIRFGPDNCFRVFYDVDIEAHEVNILARTSHQLSAASADMALPASLRSISLLAISQRICLRGLQSQASHASSSRPFRFEGR